jgi:hypothetical protein
MARPGRPRPAPGAGGRPWPWPRRLGRHGGTVGGRTRWVPGRAGRHGVRTRPGDSVTRPRPPHWQPECQCDRHGHLRRVAESARGRVVLRAAAQPCDPAAAPARPLPAGCCRVPAAGRRLGAAPAAAARHGAGPGVLDHGPLAAGRCGSRAQSGTRTAKSNRWCVGTELIFSILGPCCVTPARSRHPRLFNQQQW